MKKILIISVLFLSLDLLGQSITLSVLTKADKAYEEFSYSKAVNYYKLALKDDENKIYVTDRIATSYRNLNESDSAEVWFKRAIEGGSQEKDFYFFLAEALLSNEKVDEAKYWYEKYNSQVSKDARSAKKLDALDDFDQFFLKKDLVSIKQLNDNSPGLDFSPSYYKNGLLFVSSRPKSAWVRSEFNWDESSFLDLYYLAHEDSSASYFEGGLNTKYHEGPLVTYNNGESIAYTRNNYDGRKLIRDEKGITNLKLFFAEWDDEKEEWVDEQPFQYNDDDYSVSSPAISKDGNFLIFSSNMEGGLGESDLYISQKEESGWSQPLNMGSTVNSKGRDGFPFIDNDKLYFASEGREGLGGLDIYQVDFTDGELVGEAQNMGSPLNSSRDDFGLIINGKSGFFASNRTKETSDDIFKFLITEPELILVSGDVYDIDLNLPISKADVFFKSETNELLYTRSVEAGKYEIPVAVNSSWVVSAGKFNYELVNPLNISLETTDSAANRIFLRKLDYAGDSLDLPDATLVVDNRIQPYEETTHFVDSFAIGDTIRFDMVYYDLDKSFIRPEAKTTLDKVAKFMIEHVDVEALLVSHTDSRSSNSYNKRLSGRRSNASEDYLIFMGADPEKIKKVNRGEDKLTNNCGDNSTCTEDLHQKNRRTEIIIIKTERK